MVYKKSPIRSASWNYGGVNWKLSRSKIDLYIECPRCFYLNNKLGVSRPRTPAFTLNIAIDHLLKKEFDAHRISQTPHKIMQTYGVDAVPFQHKLMDSWRENFEGVQYPDPNTGMIISGAIDDVWVNPKGELIVIDYKVTAKDGTIEKLEDTGWEKQYQRQMEIYQWLLRKNGFKVSDTGYFVYANGLKDREAFDGKLEFNVRLIPYKGNADWVDAILAEIKQVLDSNNIPPIGENCEYCTYRESAGNIFKKHVLENAKTKPKKK